MLDDFCGAASHITLGFLLQLLDRYTVMVPTKGGFTWWIPEHVYVTTNVFPRDWYKWEGRLSQYRALARRFSEVLVFYEGGCLAENAGITELISNAI